MGTANTWDSFSKVLQEVLVKKVKGHSH